MQVVTALEDMRSRARAARLAGRRSGLVPTMGCLHEGHLALVREARRRSDLVVMSVFVNPLQFGPAEDFTRYPRDFERDQGLAASAGVDVLWAPTPQAMYPEPPRVTVAPGPAGDRLEGIVRPGHFGGVLTVVLKLFAVVEPDVAVFGRKDFQQAALVGRMVKDLNLPVEIVVVPTVRERDGLALSSRNVYLDPAGRAKGRALFRALATGVELHRAGERRATAIVDAARGVLEAEGGIVVDYVACVSAEDLCDVGTADERSVLAIAGRIGGTRLIDNAVLGQGLDGDGWVAV